MAQKIINTKIQEAYDTEANWIKYNPVLLAGQLAFSKDKYGKYKIGDGIAKWSQLQYMTLGWNDITGKPSSFTPSSHTHDDRYFTETEATNKFSPKEGSASLSKLASTITLGAGDAATILQNGSTYQQKIEIIDNSTSGDAVFGFYQSGDSGKNFNKLMTINDDGNVVANKFTGALAGNASSASSVPWSGVSGKPSTFPPSTHNHPASQITGLPTKLPNPYVLTVKANGYLLNTYDGTAAKEVNITPAVIGAATSGHTHSQYAPTSHNHSADNITSGVLPIGRGGTGGTNLTTTANSLKYYCLQGKTGIPENADLNTYRTAGVFLCPQDTRAKTIKNSPTNGSSFSLEVDFVLDSSSYIRQTVRQYNNYRTFIRYQLNAGDWTSWQYIVMGNDIIPVTSGGTGANTYSTALKNLVINGAVSGSAVPTDTNWYLCSDIADSSGTPVRRSMSSLWSYIKGKTDPLYQPKGSYAASSHTHNYAGSSSAGGAANSANMLNANAGSSTQPVYFAGGKPVACAYTLGKSVPSNAVFTDTNTWRPVQNNLTSTSTSDALSAYQGKVLKDLIDGKASSSHSHSYLPLSGGTLSGRLTANGRIYATSIGGGWISGMTPTNATLGISTQNLNGSYHPIISCKTYNSHVWNLGTITDTVGFYGFKKGRTDNGTDWAFTIDVTNGTVNSTGAISAPTFTGYLNGNAKTATNVAWSGITGKPSSFTPSSHTHSNYATTTNLSLANQRIDAHEKELGVHKTLIDGKAPSNHSHNTIRDFKDGEDISISTSILVTPNMGSIFDFIISGTQYGANQLVTMSSNQLGRCHAHTISQITDFPNIKAITNSQIDSLASL